MSVFGWTLYVDKEDSDQTARMHRLILVFADARQKYVFSRCGSYRSELCVIMLQTAVHRFK